MGILPLGLESGAISDSAISASSAYNEQSTGAKLARLNNNKSGGAWCPLQQLSSDTLGKEWIEVVLPERYAITGVATQGRYGGGYGVEFVEEYWIEFSRDNGSKWIVWNNTDGNHVGFSRTNAITSRNMLIAILNLLG